MYVKEYPLHFRLFFMCYCTLKSTCVRRETKRQFQDNSHTMTLSAYVYPEFIFTFYIFVILQVLNTVQIDTIMY